MSAKRERRRPSSAWRLPLWRVTVNAHELADGRYRIPAVTVDVGAESAEAACGFVVRCAHRDVGVPPWKPCVRASIEYARAWRVSSEEVAV